MSFLCRKICGNRKNNLNQRKVSAGLLAERLYPYGAKRAFSGSMTLEAACVVPWFLFAMLAMMQFLKIITVSSAVLAGMNDTAKDMAVYAYIRELGAGAEQGVASELLTGGISAAYAKGKVEKRASFKASDGTLHLWKSSFTGERIIDLAVTYEAKNTYTLLPVPKVKSALRARVRAWTGRDGNGSGSGQEEQDGEGEQEETVFVTETGHVYHKDENCTHIRLSIHSVSREHVAHLRNESGGKYHACERCGGGTGSTVYITDYGDRYHSSAGCSGLKRSVLSVPVSEVKDWRACSKCGGS
ncbi:MAG: hypothetical protein Q4C50_02150 [Eubacteriales bacterium]|nr:hypothetical protein [Eubacteriales bacterium]